MLAVLFLARTAMSFQFQSVGSLSPFLVPDLGLDYAALGTLIGLYMLPGLVIALPGGVLGRRFGETRMCLLGLALITLGGLLMGLAETYALATIGRVIAGVGGVIINVLLTKMVADWFAGPEMMTAMALFVNSWPVGIGLGLLTLGPFAPSPWSSWHFAIGHPPAPQSRPAPDHWRRCSVLALRAGSWPWCCWPGRSGRCSCQLHPGGEFRAGFPDGGGSFPDRRRCRCQHCNLVDGHNGAGGRSAGGTLGAAWHDSGRIVNRIWGGGCGDDSMGCADPVVRDHGHNRRPGAGHHHGVAGPGGSFGGSCTGQGPILPAITPAWPCYRRRLAGSATPPARPAHRCCSPPAFYSRHFSHFSFSLGWRGIDFRPDWFSLELDQHIF